MQTATQTLPIDKNTPARVGYVLPQIPKSLILSARGADSIPDFLRKQLGKTAQAHYLANLEPLSPQAFVALAQPYSYLAITRRAARQIDRQMIEALPRLKGISVYSTGVEWIDTECLRAHKIKLAYLPQYCSNAVAETALGLVLMAAHRLHLRYLKSLGTIPGEVSVRGFELKSCTVGIIGFGKIGQLLAAKILPLCRRVYANDIDDQQFSGPTTGVCKSSKEHIYKTCDFIIVCASQQYPEREIIAPETYRLLQPESVIINVGRSSLLNHNLLINMVKQQAIRGYIYDDLMRPADLPNELEFGKIIPTGHTAWYTDEAMANGTTAWIKNFENLIKAS